MSKTRYTVSIIGPGKVGTALCKLLIYNGHTVVSVIGRDRLRRVKAATFLKAKVHSTNPADIPPATNLILICTPGAEVARIASTLAGHKTIEWNRVLVVHTSGAEGAEILAPLRKRGARTAAVHPVQTFPGSFSTEETLSLLEGITYGYDAPAPSLPHARAFINALGGNAFRVQAASRPLYHAMCVFSSGYAVQLLAIIEQMRKRLPGTMAWQDIIGPLFLQSVRNAFHDSPARATTGPIVRGDITTVKTHLKAIAKKDPAALATYKALGMVTVGNLLHAKKLDPKTAAALRKVLR